MQEILNRHQFDDSDADGDATMPCVSITGATPKPKRVAAGRGRGNRGRGSAQVLPTPMRPGRKRGGVGQAAEDAEADEGNEEGTQKANAK